MYYVTRSYQTPTRGFTDRYDKCQMLNIHSTISKIEIISEVAGTESKVDKSTSEEGLQTEAGNSTSEEAYAPEFNGKLAIKPYSASSEVPKVVEIRRVTGTGRQRGNASRSDQQQ
ncbi:hypothetical protein ANN_03311 [Periplaneta americana]|uniref:Uncharacterized protein n=1 Tax=Periplaneta americana TaxID=6978 RepID=A0ABQ8U1H7_PERAM|nr:hypothetical protein ANN_03311 [Periplaneta americana]